MGRGAWQATVHGVTGVGQDLATKQTNQRRKCNPLQYCHSHSVFLPEKAHGERNLVSCSPWDPKDANTTEHTSKGDTFSCHTWVGWPIQWVRSQRCYQTSIPHCTRPPPHQKIILPQMAIFLRLRTTASVGIH